MDTWYKCKWWSTPYTNYHAVISFTKWTYQIQWWCTWLTFCSHQRQKQSQSYGRDAALRQACSKILIQTCCTEVLPMLDMMPNEKSSNLVISDILTNGIINGQTATAKKKKLLYFWFNFWSKHKFYSYLRNFRWYCIFHEREKKLLLPSQG